VTNLLKAEDISVGYETDVVRNLTIEVNPGELIALLGPNGAGKTTTLLSLAGALPLRSGRLVWEGAQTKAPLHKRARNGLSLVTDDRALFRRLSVRDNLLVGKCDVDYALHIFPELIPLAERKVGLLSGGEQQMLTLARALARRPKLLLFDELSLGLAPLRVRQLLAALADVVANEGVAAIVVEQHVDQILRVASRAYVLSQGSLALSGAAGWVRSQSAELQKAYLSSVF
jgi:branched-chain amino acid transport system ATP-binding protein